MSQPLWLDAKGNQICPDLLTTGFCSQYQLCGFSHEQKNEEYEELIDEEIIDSDNEIEG